MPFGGNDWLALTQEETLEPDIPICDPHHHFWDFRTQRIPYQRYLLHELADDVNSGHNVKSTVFIEARSMYRTDGPEEMRPVGEVEFVQGLAAASASGLYGPTKIAAAIVGHANLNLGDAVEPVLEALQAASPNRFRGIRHSVTWDRCDYHQPNSSGARLHNAPAQNAGGHGRARSVDHGAGRADRLSVDDVSGGTSQPGPCRRGACDRQSGLCGRCRDDPQFWFQCCDGRRCRRGDS